jgi:hypothetical protein
VHEHVAELAALVDRPGRGNAHVARDTARRRELPEELAHAGGVLRHVGIDLRVRPLEVDLRDDRGAPVTGARQVDDVRVVPLDQAIEVNVDQVLPGRRAPVPEQARLDVVGLERLAQQRVVEQVDLADRQIVRGTPVRIEQVEVAG